MMLTYHDYAVTNISISPALPRVQVVRGSGRVGTILPSIYVFFFAVLQNN